MNPFKTWKIGFLNLLLLCRLIAVSWAQNDYQSILLNYYTQQLVAHSASLFAATTESFTFITRFKKPKDRWSKVLFTITSGFLLGLSIYPGVRILVYGLLTRATIGVSPNDKYDELVKYTIAVKDYLFKKLEIPLARGVTSMYPNVFSNSV